jgi:hypothetical protein
VTTTPNEKFTVRAKLSRCSDDDTPDAAASASVQSRIMTGVKRPKFKRPKLAPYFATEFEPSLQALRVDDGGRTNIVCTFLALYL